ncbi:type I-C CRISPR-associated protein Cas7/Csd2 [Blastopirellula sp. J2-11]|uniref:type I-C CRISPR-associated protein Cas7/Csd2 n=1 Tax=Blastopirellula sp. J2-11 TaxID=2943192 RepID=UPI0021CA6ADF|nr:type I-C CRISPR-associated protein Cas7/Csd2 [Blastopirellula sp. J2-11]UUO04508.1 type I-C CRISPR-associated protein Cas7/Csd2 [Blastopirellula sp. J2-11]
MNRYDFVYFFDVTDGNPNGDPDAGNLPRVDPETGHGLVTDVCLKRKVRNYIGLVHGEHPPYEIYVKEKAILNQQHERAYQATKLTASKGKLPKELAQAKQITDWMCNNFFDIRTFGAVMTTEVNCGQVRGPVQIGFARSITPIISLEHSVTRCAVTTEREAEKQEGDNRTMGRKYSIPYGLYRAHGFINPFLAEKTGFSDDDLELFKSALSNMFEHDRSASRGLMTPKACFAFKHESQLGNARADELFARVTSERSNAETEPPRNFNDYTTRVSTEDLPSGVTMEKWV